MCCPHTGHANLNSLIGWHYTIPQPSSVDNSFFLRTQASGLHWISDCAPRAQQRAIRRFHFRSAPVPGRSSVPLAYGLGLLQCCGASIAEPRGRARSTAGREQSELARRTKRPILHKVWTPKPSRKTSPGNCQSRRQTENSWRNIPKKASVA